MHAGVVRVAGLVALAAGLSACAPYIPLDQAEALCRARADRLGGGAYAASPPRTTVSVGIGTGGGWGGGWDDGWGGGVGIGVGTGYAVAPADPAVAYTDCVYRRSGQPPEHDYNDKRITPGNGARRSNG